MKKQVSIKVNGEVVLSEFSLVINHFSSLIDALTQDIAKESSIEWKVTRLESGSALAVIEGKSDNPYNVSNIVSAYEKVGDAIANDKGIPFNEEIAREARSITRVINERISSIEMMTDNFQTKITKSAPEEEKDEEPYSFGTVSGLVETVSSRGRLRFILYDSLFDRAVNCYISKEQKDLMKDVWDKRIRVAGKVFREPESGRPFQVKDIAHLQEEETSEPGSFFDAEGIVPWEEGDEYPEDIVRRYRDA